jgi:hypothetical protein
LALRFLKGFKKKPAYTPRVITVAKKGTKECPKGLTEQPGQEDLSRRR